jgi:hypothetical protein
MKLTKSAATLLLAAISATWAVNGCGSNRDDQQQAEEQQLGVNQAALSDPAQCSSGPTCSTDTTTAGLTTSITAQVGCGQFPFVLQRTATSDLATSASTFVESISRNGNTILTTTVETNGSTVEVTVDYGAGFQGIQHAHFVTNGLVVTGEIDGRAIVPMPVGSDPNTATFQDGNPPPKVKVNNNTESVIAQLRLNADTAPSTCFEAPEVLQTSDAEMSTSVSDSGHTSDTTSTIACVACLGACYGAGIGCVFAATKLCALTGPFYGLCMLTAAFVCSGVAVACILGCNAPPGVCCPVSCGDSACCASEEECLNSSTGLCCSPNQTRCLNKSCCGETDACIDTGPIAGTCCPANRACGQSCCDELSTCTNTATGQCCPTGLGAQVCNGQCCNLGDVCVGTPGSCCPAGQACGSACCPLGFDCVNGTCTQGACPFGQATCQTATTNLCCQVGAECGDDNVSGSVCCALGEVFCGPAKGCRPSANDCLN